MLDVTEYAETATYNNPSFLRSYARWMVDNWNKCSWDFTALRTVVSPQLLDR